MEGKADKKKIIKYLKKNIRQKRFDHVMGTAECAVKMAEAYGADADKAETAALLHDSAKELSDKTILKKAKKYGFEIDKMYLDIPQLLHGAAGALIAGEKFGIEDADILEAICYHTVPKPHMCDLAKIIYVADKIEKTRTFSDVKEIREAVGRKSLDHVFLMTLKRVKLSHILNNKPLHPASLATYNHIVSSLYKTR
jgi:predicted HD superfamily hydrolase involved in NAD metabolism